MDFLPGQKNLVRRVVKEKSVNRCQKISWVFTDLLSNSPKRSPRCSSGRECTDNMFFITNKIIIFRPNREKDYTRSSYLYLYFFFETKNSHNFNYIAHVIFVLNSAMKTHLLTNQNARTIQLVL